MLFLISMATRLLGMALLSGMAWLNQKMHHGAFTTCACLSDTRRASDNLLSFDHLTLKEDLRIIVNRNFFFGLEELPLFTILSWLADVLTDWCLALGCCHIPGSWVCRRWQAALIRSADDSVSVMYAGDLITGHWTVSHIYILVVCPNSQRHHYLGIKNDHVNLGS